MTSEKWRVWGIHASLFLLSTGFIAYVLAPASVLPLFMETYSIGKPSASASISAVFLTWAVLQIPGGYILDRYDNRKLVIISAMVFVIAAGVSVIVESYPLFLFTRLVGGASAVFIIIGSINILNRILPTDHRSLGVGIFIASPPFGVAIAQYSGPQIADVFGWQGAIVAYTLLGLLGLIFVVVLLDQPIEAQGQVTLRQFFVALQNRTLLLVSIASFCTYTVWTFLNTWMPTFGTEVLGIELAVAGAASALVPLAGIVSRPGGSWLSEQIGGRLRPVIFVSFLSTILLLYGLSSASTPLLFAILLALSGAAVNLAVGLYLVYVNVLADVSTQGTSLALLLTFSQIGSLTAPVASGWLIDQISWTAGFWFAIILSAIGIIIVLVIPSANHY